MQCFMLTLTAFGLFCGSSNFLNLTNGFKSDPSSKFAQLEPGHFCYDIPFLKQSCFLIT